MANYTFSLADLIDIVRTEINEPTARIFSSSGTGQGAGQLDNFFDMGASVCAALTQAYMVEEEETCVTAQIVYSPTTYNFICIESVTYYYNASSVNYGLQRIHPQAFGNCGVDNTPARPLYYWVHYTSTLPKVYVTPPHTVPDPLAPDSTLRIKGYAVPDEYAAAGAAASEYLPSELQIVPLYYALSCVYARLGKHSLSALNMQTFINECNRWRVDSHRSVINVDSQDLARIPDVTVVRQ